MKTFFFLENTCACVLGLGLEHSCPWPRDCLSSERLSLALASDFFCVLGLGLEPCVLDSPLIIDECFCCQPNKELDYARSEPVNNNKTPVKSLK